MHGGCALGFNAVNLDSGETGTNPGRNSRKEATATDRDQHGRGLGKNLFLKLDGDCSLAGNGIRIVVGVDVGASGVARGFLCLCVRAIESPVDDHLLNPIATNRFNTLALLLGSIGRKIDGSANLQLRTGICQPLSMVACGCAHDSAAAFFFAEHAHAEISASHLKRAAGLHIFALEVNGNTHEITQSLGVHDRCLLNDIAQNFRGLGDQLGRKGKLIR